MTRVVDFSQRAGGISDLAPFKALLLRSCGHRFENEREQALLAGLCRRMAVRRIDDHAVYHTLISHDSDELLRLTELLTINETYFFREPAHLNLIIDSIVSEFLVDRKRRPVRILSAGCSTGEEPYSVAIMLRERFGAECEQLFSLFAVDIDSIAIETARSGVYGNSSFRGMDNVLLERYFESSGPGKFQVSSSIRKLVEFDVINLLCASYPHKMQLPDIILYRNVSIYFPQDIQQKIFGKLAEQLAEGGYLLVGASETMHHDVGILTLIKRDSLFIYQKTPKFVFLERRTTSRYSPTGERLTIANTSASVPYQAPEGTITKSQAAVPVTDSLRQPSNVVGPQDVKQLFDNALELARSVQYDKALTLLDAAIAKENTFEKAYCLKGSLLISASRYDEARSVCALILEKNSLCREAYLILGMIERHHGNSEGAFKRFREALYLDSSCWLAHFYTGEILFAQRDSKRARNSYEAALKILENGSLKELGQTFFPLSFNAEQFIVICRHKLSLLKEN
jgi:chemotaxis protein methyltransferase CheR